MKITVQQFDEFWEQNYPKVKNPQRSCSSLRAKIEELGDSDLLDEYIISMSTGRERTRRIVLSFYNFLQQHYAKPVDSSLAGMRFYDYPFERQLEIAKYLHTERTTPEICDRFNIDERTARSDLNDLEDGITVLNSTIRISSQRKGRKKYFRTTLHPVFLPLNLTELYALTVYLDRIIHDHDPNAAILRGIIRRIKPQLSEYALDKLFPGENVENIQNTYIDDEYMARQRSSTIGYLMKSGNPCSFYWNNRKYSGRIVWKNGNYRIQLEDGSFLDAALDEVDIIADSFSYT